MNSQLYKSPRELDKKIYVKTINPKKLYKIGKLYGQNLNFEGAIEYWKKASNLGDVKSTYKLGNLYRYFLKVANETLSLKYFKRIVNYFPNVSQEMIGRCSIEIAQIYQSRSNISKWKKYIKISAKNYECEAIESLAKYYQFEKINYNKMLKYYNIILNEKHNNNCKNYNHNSSKYFLGQYYKNNNKNLMIKYFTESAENGNQMAIVNIGLFYLYEENNLELAKKYLIQNVHTILEYKGYHDRMISMGLYYRKVGDTRMMRKCFGKIRPYNFFANYILGEHYQYTEKNYMLMKKYYWRIVNNFSLKNNTGNNGYVGKLNIFYIPEEQKTKQNIINNLLDYYQNIETNTEEHNKFMLYYEKDYLTTVFPEIEIKNPKYIIDKDWITFHKTFNEELTQDIFTNCKHIEFGKLFNKKIDCLPNGIETIILGKYFNQPINNLPTTIKKIIFNTDFNHPLDNLPTSIQEIYLPKSYKLPLYNLPPNIIIKN